MIRGGRIRSFPAKATSHLAVHGFYGHYCFLPLYVFCGSRLLVAYLRPSNIDAPLHTRAILKLLVARLRQAWPNVRIVLRADSSFARWKLRRWCEKNSVFYVVGLSRNKVLERLGAPFMQAAEAEYQRTQQKVRNFHEFRYAAQSWECERRVIVKAERLEQGPNVRFVLTNLDAPPRRSTTSVTRRVATWRIASRNSS